MARDRKYSRILQAAKYYSAVDNYIKYITDSSKRGSRVGTGKARPKSKRYFIDPFGIKLGTGQVVAVTASQTAFDAYKGDINTRFAETEADGDNIIPVRNFKAARAIITTGRAQSGTPKTSAVTGMKYLSYGGQSTSIAFGRKNETEEFAAAATEIKGLIQTRVSGAIVTVSPEVVPVA